MNFKGFCIFLVLFSCTKQKKLEAVRIFGHGGNGLQISNSVYHDNTQESIDLALAQNGCEGVEIDIQLSKEGTAWLFHDLQMNPETDENGCLTSKSDAELGQASYASVHREKLIRLSEAEFYGKDVFLDLKHVNPCQENPVYLEDFLDDLLAFRERCAPSKVALITSFPDWIGTLNAAGFVVYYESRSYHEALEVAKNKSPDGFVFKNSVITSDQVSFLKNEGYEIVVFEVRSPKGIRKALKKHPDCILADDLKAAMIEKY